MLQHSVPVNTRQNPGASARKSNTKSVAETIYNLMSKTFLTKLTNAYNYESI